jgi:TetR/AcrR family transcriptional repressor of nem operon
MGRSKEFEESVVLRKAMELFLEQGYEGTSMSDLIEHMGIHKKSLYDTFGDKHSLFMRTLDVFGEQMQADLRSEVLRAGNAKQAIKLVFDRVIEGMWDVEHRFGCLFVNSSIELGLRDAEVKERAGKAFAQTEHFLMELIKKGQQEGEITYNHDAEALAEYLHNSLLGIRVLIRNNTCKEKLYRISEFSISVLDK